MSDEHREDAGIVECEYCGCLDCDYDCDESQAGGFDWDAIDDLKD